MGQHDGVVDIVHGQLCYATLQCQAVSLWQSVCRLVEVDDHLHGVVQTFLLPFVVLLMNGRGGAWTVVVGLGIGLDERLSP